jgi:hypothetical protein
MRWVLPGLLVVLGLLAGCGSPSAPSPGVAAAGTAAAASSPVSTGNPFADGEGSASAPAAPAPDAAVGTAADDQGDTVKIGIGVGAPVPLTALDVAGMSACDGTSNLGYDAGQAMAVPVAITVTLTSSVATPVTVGLDGSGQVTSGGDTQPNGNLPYWAAGEGGDAECALAGPMWSSLAPGQPGTWTGWLIDPLAITPDDPEGSSAGTTVFLEPDVVLNASTGDYVPDLAASRNLVKCAAGVPFGAVIAVSPQVALADGCTAYTGG